MLSTAVVALLLSLGCAASRFAGPSGPFDVWVCPPAETGPAPVAPVPPGGDTPA